MGYNKAIEMGRLVRDPEIKMYGEAKSQISLSQLTEITRSKELNSLILIFFRFLFGVNKQNLLKDICERLAGSCCGTYRNISP